MAKSLDELVDFLLDEIALDGDRGASLQDIVHYTKHFYAQPYPTQSLSLLATPPPATNRVDRKFIGQLWQWLAQHNDLSIGREDEYRTSSLDEIELAFPELLAGAFNPLNPVGLPSGGPRPLNNVLLSRPAAAQKKDVGPRVVANQDRVYHAVCGHEPDPARVSELEFSLLRTIGAARNDGILQGELGRVTKQDKRSVPKRTDALHEKKYVVKELAYHGGHKTSRIFLRRFAHHQTNSNTTESAVRLLDLARQILAACKEYPFIAPDDLAQLLSISSPSKRRVLDQVIKHLARRECLRRVKTAFAPDSAVGDLRLTLQLVRELDDTDLERKDGDLVDLDTHLDTAVGLLAEADIDSDEDTADIEKESDILEDPSSLKFSRPSWNPDRSLSNVIHDFAVLSDDHGITNVSVRQQITGLTVKRPVESMLVRLSRSTLKAQSSSVRDLALVKTTEGQDGVNRFVYRSLGTFSHMVDRGDSAQSAADGGDEFAKRIGSSLGRDTLDMPERDSFGFTKRTRLGRQMKSGRATLEDLANAPGPEETVILRPGEAAIVTDPAGVKTVVTKPERASNISSRRSKTPRTPKTPKRLSCIVILKLHPKSKPTPTLQQSESSSPKSESVLQQPEVILQQHEPIPQQSESRSNQPEPRLEPPGLMPQRHEPALQQPEPVTKQSQSIPKKTESNKKQKGVMTTIGRPRKFTHGTEEYWQTLFWIKKHGCDLEIPTNTKEKGLMRNPDCLKMFADRPRNFDQTLLRALQQELPVPRTPASINDTWVIKTNEFLDRRGVGAFYLPSGTSDLRLSEWSCQIIIRSTRLREVDMTDRRRPASILFLSSSAAHSSRHYRSLQWYLEETRKGTEVRSSWTADDSKTTDRVTKGTSTSKEDNASWGEKASREGNTIVRTPSSDFVITDGLIVPDPPPIPAPKSSKSSAYVSKLPKKPIIQQGRAQRRRRPTQKALESARNFVPDELDTELSSDVAAVSEKAYTKSKAVEVLPPSFSEKHFSTVASTPIDTITDSAVNDNGAIANGMRTSSLGSTQTISHEPSNWNSSENEVRHASCPPVSESIQRTLESAGVQIERASPESTQIQRISLALPDAGSRAATDIGEHFRDTDTMSKDVTDATFNGTAESEPEPQPPDLDTNLVADPAPLQLLAGRDAVPYYKKFLSELVYIGGGVVPHDPSLLKRAMGPKTVEAHVESNMNIKLIKSCISQLTQNGKLKIMQFAFQRNGFNHTKAIIALPNTQRDDQLFLAMQTKISLLPVNVDYVPPELEREASRKPKGKLRHPDSPILGARIITKRVASARPKRQNDQSEPRSRRGSSVRSRQLSVSPAPPDVSPNTGFLTLKVPSIARIQTDKAFTSNYFSLPAQPLMVDPSTRTANAQTSSPGTSSVRRNGVRNPRRSIVNGATRTIQWRVPKRTPLPTSLRAILAYDHRVNEIDHNLSLNPALETFDKDVDFVATWEQKSFDDLQDRKSQEWNFINHLSFKKEFVSVRREGDLQFRQITFDSLHEEVETDLPEAGSWDVFAKILSKEAAKQRKAGLDKNKRKRKTHGDFIDGQSDDEGEEEGLSDFNSSGEEPKRKRQRGPNHKWRRKPRVAGTDKDRRRHKRNHVNPRGIGLRDIPKALAHRITTAIVVVRVLTGGLDKYLDWKLVARLVPGEPESMLQSRWRTLSTRYNNDFDAMVQDLQTKYLDALADNKVPSVNYNDLHGTDWEGIHAWAVANINAEGTSTDVMELPPNRDEFLELNTAEVGEPISVRHLHNISLQYTQATKEDFWCSVIFGTSAKSLPEAIPKHIEASFPAENDEADIIHARARSWVFAAVVTPHQSFDPYSAHEKLRRLAEDKRECEQLIESTLKKLYSNKMVVTKDSADAVVESDGSTLSGTYNWKLSTKFLDRFEMNRYITSKMLKQAVKYKIEILDPSFACGDPVIIPGDPLLEDGVMVAIFNLMNTGMLQLEPGTDMPATRYGIDGESEGYQTRGMDKKNLFFSTILRPTPTYVLGDLSDRHNVAIPRSDMDQEDGLGLIPMWFDINYDFRPEIWDLTVGAVTGLISCRPGVSTIQLVRTLDHVLSLTDLGLIIQYLVDGGMIAKTCTGWETTETWWFAVGAGTESGAQDGF